MHRHPLRLSICLFILLTLSGCGGRAVLKVEQQIEHFYTHQSTFEALARTGCEAREALDTRFFRYPMDVDGEQPELIQHYFTDMEKLLHSIGMKSIVLRQFEGIECSLYVQIAGMSFFGEGYSLGYWYQPADHGTYEYTDDFFSQENIEYRKTNRIRGKEPVKFSIELESGWYHQYHMYP